MFVSGTTSILGHETVHAGDFAKQWDVATANIAHLIGADSLASQGMEEGFTLRDLDQIKVYYRHASDLATVKQLAQATFDARADVRFLKVDICRADLFVEMEGIATHRDE